MGDPPNISSIGRRYRRRSIVSSRRRAFQPQLILHRRTGKKDRSLCSYPSPFLVSKSVKRKTKISNGRKTREGLGVRTQLARERETNVKKTSLKKQLVTERETQRGRKKKEKKKHRATEKTGKKKKMVCLEKGRGEDVESYIGSRRTWKKKRWECGRLKGRQLTLPSGKPP